MNCKQGDIAVIIANPPPPRAPVKGRIVEVLERVAADTFYSAPDGDIHRAITCDAWAIKFIDGTVNLETIDGVGHHTQYALAADRCLRPIRGDKLPEALEHDEAVPA